MITMNTDRNSFLNLQHTPARMNAEETAWFLGFGPHEISILIAAHLLKPLGSPATNGCKYFSTKELERLGNDPAWMSKASDAIVKYWRRKNAKKTPSTLKPSRSRASSTASLT